MFFNQSIQKDCSTASGERAAVYVSYDTGPNIGINAGISCSSHTLIKPPLSGGSHVAQCPQTTGGGTTAVVRFNPTTGQTECSGSFGGGGGYIVLNTLYCHQLQTAALMMLLSVLMQQATCNVVQTVFICLWSYTIILWHG